MMTMIGQSARAAEAPRTAGTDRPPVEAPTGPGPDLTIPDFVMPGGGGSVILLLIGLLALAALGIILYKAVQFLFGRVLRRSAAERAIELLRRGDAGAALAACKDDDGPVARVVGTVVQARAFERASETTAREEARHVADAELAWLRGLMRTLSLIAVIAPLLGLLGTVVDVVDALRMAPPAGGSTMLAGALADAMRVASAGLGVAIVAVIGLGVFASIIARAKQAMDDFTGRALAAAAVVAPRGDGSGIAAE